MGHRKLFGEDLVGGHIDDATSLGPSIAPAGHDIAPAHGRYVSRSAVLHREPVEVTAVLGRQPGNELRLPDRLEAVSAAESCQARIEGVDENRLAARQDADFVDVQITRDLTVARHEYAIESVLRLLARPENVLQSPHLD